MPQRLTITSFMAAAQEYWTNVYWTTDPVNAAGDTMDAVVAAHQMLLRSDCIITTARIDDAIEDTDNYDTVSYNVAGTLTAGGATMFPLWNTVRVDFDVAGGGRPSRKYMRGVTREDEVSFMNLGADTITNANAYGNAIVAVGTICDPQGNLFVDAVIWPYVQMRQLGRKRRKKSTPSTPIPV